MLLQTIEALFRKYRLFCYQKLFAAVREKPGSLSATEAFSADIIHLLGSPTISQFAETIGISQPNATYKVNQLAAKGYLHKTVQAHDRREIVRRSFPVILMKMKKKCRKRSLRSPRSSRPRSFAAQNACCWRSVRFCNEGGHYGYFRKMQSALYSG